MSKVSMPDMDGIPAGMLNPRGCAMEYGYYRKGYYETSSPCIRESCVYVLGMSSVDIWGHYNFLFGYLKISSLLFADDVVLLAYSNCHMPVRMHA